jgi:hypothetical protein
MRFFKPNDVTLKNIVGTRWVTPETSSDNNATIEIVDEKYCIYSCLDRVKLHTYKINNGQIFIGNSISYAIRDNIFFHDDTPLYIKESTTPA